MPALLQPSEDLLERLQRHDPALDLHYAGQGEWWLGRVKPDAPRRQAGLRMMANLERIWGRNSIPTTVLVPINRFERWKQDHLPRWLLGFWPVRCEKVKVCVHSLLCPPGYEDKPRLMMEGFGLVERALWPEVPDGRLIKRYEESRWWHLTTPEYEADRAITGIYRDEAKRARVNARMKDYMDTEGRWLFQRIVKHRTLVSVH